MAEDGRFPSKHEIPDGIRLTPLDADFRRDPYAIYRKLRALDPVHEDAASLWPGSSWTITSYDLVRDLLRDDRLSVDSRRVGIPRDPRADNAVTRRAPDMMSLDDPDHRRLRGLVQQAFTPGRVQRLRPCIEEIATRLIDDSSGKAAFDVIADYAKPIPTIVIAELLGVDSEHHDDFKRWTDTLLMQGYPQPSEAQWRQIVAADAALRSYMEAAIEERRAHPRDDLISRLIAARDDDDRLTEDEVVGMCTLLIGAGNFTTTDLIGNAILAFLRNVDQRDRLNADASLIGPAIEEALRYDAPSLIARRYALEDLTIAGKKIGAGSVVNLVIAAANHDPAIFPDADRLDVARQKPPHLSFGRGVHHCLGAPLARLEAEIAVGRFFQAFPSAELLSVKRNRTMGFRGCTELRVRA